MPRARPRRARPPPGRQHGGPFVQAPAAPTTSRPEPDTPATRPQDLAADQPATKPAPTAGRAVVAASVDLGSNSVHLLVALVAGHRLGSLDDESVFLGLGAAVAGRSYLGREARATLTESLVHYADMARRQGAVNLTLLGTEPLRRAADGAAIVQEIVDATNAPLHVLSHEEEAYLTLIGVTEGMPVTRETLVIDIGGGSSEFCVVDPTRRPRAAGLRIGSARLTDRFVTHDPPTRSELAAMRAAATEAIADALDAQPGEIVAVGGTASNLLKVLPAAMMDRTLTRERVALIQTILAREPAAAAAQRHLVNPVRARILPAGAAIMDAILQRYGATSIRVSESGVREGAILAVEHAGPAWRDRLADLAHGWRT